MLQFDTWTAARELKEEKKKIRKKTFATPPRHDSIFF